MKMSTKSKTTVSATSKQSLSVKKSPSTSEEIHINILDPLGSEDDFIDQIEEAEETIPEETPPVRVPLTRTELLILDYLQFKAARVIQTAARRWYCQLIYKRKHAAIITIQCYWRGFFYRRKFFRILEDEIQNRIVFNHYISVVRIQAWWRGWLVRMHVHDHYAMLRAQLREAKELLHCVAYKLHYLLRTHQIPGIYSLRHTTALSKVEQLLVAMNLWEYNAKEALKRQKECYEMEEKEKLDNKCDPKCQDFYKMKDVEERMTRILKIYKEGTISHPRVFSYQQKMALKRNKNKKSPKPKPTFCSDIVNSLARWRILNANNMKLNRDVLKNHETLNSFLDDLRSIYENMISNPSCVCISLTKFQLP